jgi:solute carrier family 25 (mitochondrial citrate transporter), member 1
MSSKPSNFVAAIAGGIAGASETIITYPAEFIKTRRQLPTRATGLSSSWGILRSAFHSQGVAGIYSGSPALIASNTAKGGIRFFSFQSSKKVLEQSLGPTNPLVNVLAGLSAGATESILVVTPAEVIKTQSIDLSAGGLKRRSTIAVAGQVIKANGILGLWRGLGPVLCKQGTNSAVRFASFGAIKDWVTKSTVGNYRLDNTSSTLLAGALSGVVTT